MKSFKLKFSTSIMSLTLLSGVAIAQNTKTNMHQANPTKNQYNWTGFYGGLNVGGVFNDVDLNSNHFGLTDPTGTCNASSNFSSFFPGVQLGYLRQLESNVILGVEGDFTYNVDQTGKVSCNCPVTPSVSDHYSIKNRLQGSIRGRLGYLVKPQILPFLSAGGSFADLGMAYNNEGGDYYSTNTTQSGWLVGGGLEWGFTHNWSVRAEYYYIDYSSMNMKIPNIYGLYDPNGNAHVNLNANNVRLAINHWF
jgi:outer membrane immunogenic protein